jgi:hypothetical protein
MKMAKGLCPMGESLSSQRWVSSALSFFERKVRASLRRSQRY